MSSTCLRNLCYSPDADGQGIGDLFFPVARNTQPPVILMHGGGWNALSKESLESLSRPFLDAGHVVFNINYRLLSHAPWPACGQDCLAAAEYVLAGGLEEYGLPSPESILLCGGSAGGHLAMMTGLALPPEKVEAIISLAGPSRLDKLRNDFAPELGSSSFLRFFFGLESPPSPSQISAASPALCVRPGAPPLLCVHSHNDTLVFPDHSREAVHSWRMAGSGASLVLFEGTGKAHGLFESDDLESSQVPPPACDQLRKFLRPSGTSILRHLTRRWQHQSWRCREASQIKVHESHPPD